jgi:hypothetical protein
MTPITLPESYWANAAREVSMSKAANAMKPHLKPGTLHFVFVFDGVCCFADRFIKVISPPNFSVSTAVKCFSLKEDSVNAAGNDCVLDFGAKVKRGQQYDALGLLFVSR